MAKFVAHGDSGLSYCRRPEYCHPDAEVHGKDVKEQCSDRRNALERCKIFTNSCYCEYI
jgi:hypothetical protein